MTEDHIPAPAGHAPRLEQYAHRELPDVTVSEVDNTGGWIAMHAEDCMEVRQ
jgi:hypothetical protein